MVLEKITFLISMNKDNKEPITGTIIVTIIVLPPLPLRQMNVQNKSTHVHTCVHICMYKNKTYAKTKVLLERSKNTKK